MTIDRMTNKLKPNSVIGALSWSMSASWIGLVTVLLSMSPVWADQSAVASSDSVVELNLTLDEAIQLALERNRGLLNQRLNRETQRFSLDVAEDQYRPKFTIGSSSSHNRDDEVTDVRLGANLRIATGGTIGLGVSESISGDDDKEMAPTLTFSQPLLKGGGANIDQAQLRQARLDEKSNILTFRRNVSDLVVSTISAYRALIQAFRQVEISEASLQRAQRQLEVTSALIQAGRIARREITRSEATVANRELALVRSKNSLESANYNLISTLDLDSSTRIKPQEFLSVDEIQHVEIGQIDIHEHIATALARRSDYLTAEQAIESAEIDLRVAENNKLPNLSLDFEVTRNRPANRNDHQARLSLTIPLNDRSTRLAILRAENALIMAQRNLEELRESIGILVRRAINDVEVGGQVMVLARESRQLAEENLTIEQNKFSQGLSSTFEVSASEDDLVSAQNSETDAIISYLNVLVGLQQALGTVLDTWGIEVEEVPQ